MDVFESTLRYNGKSILIGEAAIHTVDVVRVRDAFQELYNPNSPENKRESAIDKAFTRVMREARAGKAGCRIKPRE